MNRILGPTVCYAPDGEAGAAGAETTAGAQSADTTAGATGGDTLTGGAGGDTTAGAAGADTTSGAAGEDTTGGTGAKTPFWQRRIDELTRQKNDEARRANAAEMEARLLRDAAGGASTVAGAAAQPSAGKVFTQDDVQAEAQRLNAATEFNNRCNALNAQGKTKHGADWDRSLQNFAHIGGLISEKSMPLLAAVFESEHGPDILFALGNDLDRAAELMEMSPIKLAREITKMDMDAGKPRKTSGAPQPAPRIEGSGLPSEKNSDEMSDSEWAKWRAADLAKKRKEGQPTPRV